MKKSIITMVAVVIVAAINLNVYMDDAEASRTTYYVQGTGPCEVIEYYSDDNTIKDSFANCQIYYSLNNNSSGGEDSSEDGVDNEDTECTYDVEIENCFGETELVTIFGTTSSCVSGGGTSCAPYDDCEDSDDTYVY